MKTFNTLGLCIPEKHYMVDLSVRVAQIKEMVETNKYFTINRARQYGKTTTIDALARVLVKDFYVVSMDFQDYGEESFANEDAFCRDFSIDFCSILSSQCQGNGKLGSEILRMEGKAENDERPMRLFGLFRCLKRICYAAD